MSLPPQPRIVHPLPRAPAFVGRGSELDALRRFWQSNSRGVFALVGLGGAGKTAVAAEFLHELLEIEKEPVGLFVWSFYQEPDAGLFLQEALRFFAPAYASATDARGAGLLHLLSESLTRCGPGLLVLDGLE